MHLSPARRKTGTPGVENTRDDRSMFPLSETTICAGCGGSPSSSRSDTSSEWVMVKNTDWPIVDAPAMTPSAATRDSPS
jgi:hypothetical protein